MGNRRLERPSDRRTPTSSVPRRLALSLLFLALPAGCARCSSSPSADGGPPPPTELLPSEALPPPAPWSFAPERRENNVALPERCLPRGPLVRALVAKRTRFVADPEALGALAIADVADRPPRVTAAAALTLEPEGKSHDPQPLPWSSPTSVPRLARLADSSWVAGFDRPGADGMSRVGLFHNGVAELLGEGDAFEAVDLRCTRTPAGADAGAPSPRCALLTSRIGKVAPSGALVWIGSPAEPAARWKQVEIQPPSGDGSARPFGLAAIDEATVTAILAGAEGLTYVLVEDGAPREIARIPAPHGVIEATALPTPVAMVYATPLNEDGCARESVEGGGAGIHFARPGRPPSLVRTPAPPFGGAIRRLATGALATWIAPLSCTQPRRVIFAVVLDAEGTPVSAPMAVADGSSFAVAAAGADVDLFLQDDSAQVSWARMRCAP